MSFKRLHCCDQDQSKQAREIDGEKFFVQTIGGTEVIVQTRQYRLVTPLFGGGATAGANDPDYLIRGTEIRGQLRFWWRAIRGGQPAFQGSLIKMKAREDEIWGAASNTKQQDDGMQRASESTTRQDGGFKR